MPWVLSGDALGHKGFSCSSLTLALLEKGGLNNIAGSVLRGVVSPTSHFVVSPNNLVNQLQLAKILEERAFPETIDFKPKEKRDVNTKKEILLTVKADKVSMFDLKALPVSEDSSLLLNKLKR